MPWKEKSSYHIGSNSSTGQRNLVFAELGIEQQLLAEALEGSALHPNMLNKHTESLKGP